MPVPAENETAGDDDGEKMMYRDFRKMVHKTRVKLYKDGLYSYADRVKKKRDLRMGQGQRNMVDNGYQRWYNGRNWTFG